VKNKALVSKYFSGAGIKVIKNYRAISALTKYTLLSSITKKSSPSKISYPPFPYLTTCFTYHVRQSLVFAGQSRPDKTGDRDRVIVHTIFLELIPFLNLPNEDILYKH
jgi:hypothetical protein